MLSLRSMKSHSVKVKSNVLKSLQIKQVLTHHKSYFKRIRPVDIESCATALELHVLIHRNRLYTHAKYACF